MAPKDPNTFMVFQQRFLSGQPQLNPVLDALGETLTRLWDLYDPLCANSIIVSVFEFLTATCMEPKLERLPRIRSTQRFPWFIRERNGVGVAYALFMFAKSSRTDIMEFIQAIPDMNFWIDATNDLMSSVLFIYRVALCVI